MTIFKQFQEFFQPHDGVKGLKGLEMLEMHFKREISNLSCFQADELFPDAQECVQQIGLDQVLFTFQSRHTHQFIAADWCAQ
jgi:hypothetical protein